MGVLARLISPTTSEPWAVADLSILGALLVGDRSLPVGSAQVFEFEVPGEVPVYLTARVVRCVEREGRHHAGLQFVEMAGDVEDFVHDTILTELLRDRRRMVLALTRDVGTAIDLWSDLDDIGCDARVCATIEDAEDALFARDLPVSTVLIDARNGMDDELARFVAFVRMHFPALRCLVWQDGPAPDLGFEGVQWCSSEDWRPLERAALFGPERRFDAELPH
jgi:hypothetical protein